MNNTNSKLMSIFLILGILFFLSMFYIIMKEEILGKNDHNFHSVNLESIKVIKNDFIDTSKVNSIQRVNESMSYVENNEKQNYYFIVVNENDKNIYAKSGSFNIKSLSAPQNVSFYDNSLIPQLTLKDNYDLIISSNNKTIETFSLGNLYNKLKLNSKQDNVTEIQELKLISSDNKLILFLNVRVD